MSQVFNVDTFLDYTTTDSNDTVFVPVPIGEYTAVISEVKARQFAKKDDPSITFVALDVTWEIDDQPVKELLGRDKVTVKQSVFLDISASGGLDMGKGKNVGLGRLRDAVNLNGPGQPFAPSMLNGRIAKITVTHATGKEPGSILANVGGVARLA